MQIPEIVSLHKLESSLKPHPFVPSLILKKTPSFYLADTLNEKYVKPNFTNEVGSFKKGKLPKVILISAAGATGKSELTQYLSCRFQIPIFDLSKHSPVASNSLTGLFFETLGPQGLATYVQDLKNGNGMLIIDALDEGHLKTTVEGFNSFLDGIVGMCREAQETPFILLGRNQVIENTWLYLEEQNVESSILRLESFTIEQAVEFIDKQVGNTNFNKPYMQVRDYIINSVEVFFKSPSEINKKEYQSFIGYAPVLLSIAILLKKSSNFSALYEELNSKHDKGISLIISIVEYILTRDKEEKVYPSLLTGLLKDRPNDFKNIVKQSAYSMEEQCARILFKQLGVPFKKTITDDPLFELKYNEKIDEFLEEHPFLKSNGEIQNTVFECFIIAKLMNNSLYSEYVLTYLNTKYKDAFMLFFVFEKLSIDKIILPQFLSHLYSSIRSLDSNKNYFSMEIFSAEEEGTSIDLVNCEVELIFGPGDKKQNFSFTLQIRNEDVLALPPSIGNFHIQAPVNVLLSARRIEISAPVTIDCSSIKIDTSEFVVIKSKANSDLDETIHLEADILIDYSCQSPSLINYLSNNDSFVIITNNKLSFPFGSFISNNQSAIQLTDENMEKYLRLRSIIMLLRSHSKGSMAKLKDKIEHKRVLKNNIGRMVLDMLVENGVLYLDAHLYHLNQGASHTHLGVTYLDLKRKIVNEKTIEFLNNIN